MSINCAFPVFGCFAESSKAFKTGLILVWNAECSPKIPNDDDESKKHKIGGLSWQPKPEREKDMKGSILIYPEFNSLPKGVKMMLLESESFFFNEELARTTKPQRPDFYPMRSFKLKAVVMAPSGFAPSLSYAV